MQLARHVVSYEEIIVEGKLVDWVTLAILGTALLGVSNIIDSHLLSRRMDIRIFLLLLGGCILISGIVIFILFPLPQDVGINVMLVAVAQGIGRTIGVVLMFYVFKREEVSRAIPVVNTYPIFVAIMSMPVLGESLNILEWLAVFIVVAGAVMISIRRNLSGGVTLGKPFILLLCSALLFALSDIGGKYVLSSISFFNLYALSAFCMGGICIIVWARPDTIRQFKKIKQRNYALGLLALDELLSIFGVILGMRALQLGPVALVSTVTSSRPIFVIFIALIISRISPGFLEFAPGRGLLALRLLASAMIVSGIAIIYLT